MHLLNAQPGSVIDGSEALDLGQTPGQILVLSSADTDLAALSMAREELGQGFPTLRLANVMQLSHHMSVDLYCEEIVKSAELVIIRLLGGVNYWSYGVEQVSKTCASNGSVIAFLPGDDQPDEVLMSHSSLPPESCHRLWQYLVHGGSKNAREFLNFAASILNSSIEWREPRPLLKAGLYWPGIDTVDLATIRDQWRVDAQVVTIVFYRAHLQSGNLKPIIHLIEALKAEFLSPLPVYISSLKDPQSDKILQQVFAEAPPEVILNTTGFSASTPGGGRTQSAFDDCDCPVFQVILSGGSQEVWQKNTQGLSPRDIAMNVALPEVDGRIITRAISFKDKARYDPLTEHSVLRYEPKRDRIKFVAKLAANWCRLCKTPEDERCVAIILANYPNRDGRIGNGVGLDTPESVSGVMSALAKEGYDVGGKIPSGSHLITRLLDGPTNAKTLGRRIEAILPLTMYKSEFSELPRQVQQKIQKRWGDPIEDPFFVLRENGFAIPIFICGKIVVGLQPARGYNIDPQSSYHDPDLPPPHGYLAFYFWLRKCFNAHVIIHFGKHGNLEWLPGKALALSDNCFPEAVLGPIPHLYPFIVNDPGEGAQAKRRGQAVIVDHLTPPLTRAEIYGPLAELEQLVDEYFDATGIDPTRCNILSKQILDKSAELGISEECGISLHEDCYSALSKIDGYLCELKELQIRDGLHIFGQSPTNRQLTDLLIALARLPSDTHQSLHRALADDLGLVGFDPLEGKMGEIWDGPGVAGTHIRTKGDLITYIENLAFSLVSGNEKARKEWTTTKKVLAGIESTLRPAVVSSGASEIKGLLAGLNGKFVLPGPSGAPSRGRCDVLPTGRNFYSLDTRAVPTPAAWALGWKSAALLIERHTQEQGEWLRHVGLSVWGTSNMRTGGDDIAQALALLGVEPVWEPVSRRVTNFAIMPLNVLGRPRVDVTLRISGFFRDAFPAQIDLFASAVRAVAQLDEDPEDNPIAAAVSNEKAAMIEKGIDSENAELLAGFRVFGSKPGAYGAGLQALIDESCWQDTADLAQAYIEWSGYAYGAGAGGVKAKGQLERRLQDIEAVLHNQDNREHDLLDSDDYYQFEGGMVAAVDHISGRKPVTYHNDHSRPENPRIFSLSEEIARTIRARGANPKWISGVMRHGYKGAFEIAATVDYLFAFAATTGAVDDRHFDLLFEAYIEDKEVLKFLKNANVHAMDEIAQRFMEALNRGLWQPKSNSALATLISITEKNPVG